MQVYLRTCIHIKNILYILKITPYTYVLVHKMLLKFGSLIVKQKPKLEFYSLAK